MSQENVEIVRRPTSVERRATSTRSRRAARPARRLVLAPEFPDAGTIPASKPSQRTLRALAARSFDALHNGAAEEFVEAGDSVLVGVRQRRRRKRQRRPTRRSITSRVWTFRDGKS